MCQRYLLTTPLEALQSEFAFDGGVPYPPRPNIRPGEPIAVLRHKPGIEASRIRELALVRWGLVPHWVKDMAAFGMLMNARAETILEKPSFKAPMRHRRCIIPANGWYVWTGKAPRKTTHLVHAAGLDRSLDRPLAFAGLWDHWLGSDGSELDTAAIITVAATAAVAAYDERMPVLLDAQGVADWLDVRGVDQTTAARLLVPSSSWALDVATISSRLDDPSKNEPERL
jgi:putative SOS response-associated peptidase YedK